MVILSMTVGRRKEKEVCRLKFENVLKRCKNEGNLSQVVLTAVLKNVSRN